MSYVTEVLADTPRAYYRLGETSGSTAFDSSGNGLDGTYVGSPTLATGLLLGGDSNGARNFSGTGQWVTLPSLAHAGSFSVELWASISGWGSDGSSRWFNGDFDAPLLGGTAAEGTLTSGPGSLDVIGGYTNTSFTYGDVRATDVTSLNVPFHTVYTYNNTSKVSTIYLNGAFALAHTNAAVTMRSDNTHAWYIGRHYGVTAENTVGVLDEVAYYWSELSPARIAAHYLAGRPTAPLYEDPTTAVLPAKMTRMALASPKKSVTISSPKKSMGAHN